VKRPALALVLLTGACAASPTPTRDELAQSLRAFDGPTVAPTDITHIACLEIEEEPTEFACRWRQRDGREWKGWQSVFALSGDGWQLIDTPAQRP